MQRVRFRSRLWALLLLASTSGVFADGMVFPEVYRAKVEIPSQQALIHYSGGTERLVIETSFLGEGTNFAWVVPLPSAPDVKPVSERFFESLQQAFQPSLIHRVNPYYAGVLLVCGLAYLGWRAMKDEVSWLADLPLCLLLAVGAGLLGRHAAFGFVALGFALAMRLFARAPTSYALILLIGTSFAAFLILVPDAHRLHLIDTLGSEDASATTEAIAGVTVLSIQHAGVFDSTTIRGRTPREVLEWLRGNGYEIPRSAEPAIRHYVDRGWVFVASKARLNQSRPQLAALHPLAFTFASSTQVYPTRLTAIAEGNCAIDLYIFGDRRATAPHFSTVRCDRLTLDQLPRKRSATSGLRIGDLEILSLIGTSTVGTKLSGTLSPTQMAHDIEVGTTFFWGKGRHVYSHSGALSIALNFALPLGALGWLLVGMSKGGWNVDERWILRWRRRSLAAAAVLGLAVFLLVPKVEIEIVQPSSRDEATFRPDAVLCRNRGPNAHFELRRGGPSPSRVRHGSRHGSNLNNRQYSCGLSRVSRVGTRSTPPGHPPSLPWPISTGKNRTRKPPRSTNSTSFFGGARAGTGL